MIANADRSQHLQGELAGWRPRRVDCVDPFQRPEGSRPRRNLKAEKQNETTVVSA